MKQREAAFPTRMQDGLLRQRLTLRIGNKPNQYVIQTSSPNPVRILPESDPSTMKGYLKWFVERTGH